MNCERCGKHPAGIQYTEYRDGEMQKLRICEHCAHALGFHVDEAPAEVDAGPPKLVSVVEVSGPVEGSKKERDDDRRCPRCGLTAAQLRKQSRFGCPECYETFVDSLDAILQRMHGAVRHRGRLPGGRIAAPPDVVRLRAELRRAVAVEDFEKAARIRDTLRRVGSLAPEDDA